ncbi:MAG: dihydrodipicolinate synthase family protein [bacterium]|nr:dihydrodipicolinate synthase family protein [bacterium]
MPPVKIPNELQSQIQGPVNSLPTTFLSDGEIDWEGIRNIIEVGIAGGSRVSLLTYGDSQFDFLSDEEVTQLTHCMVEQVNGRALTVAATRRWPDRIAIEFARYCQELGVDVLMVLPSDHALPAGKIAHYKAIAEIMPVMLVGFPPHNILDALLDIPNICCFKEDGSLDYAADTLHKYGNHWTFLTGGGLWRNYTQWPWNPAFFCYLSSFAPHIATQYWNAYQKKDVEAAATIIRNIERPLFALADTIGGKFQALWRAALECNQIASRYLRAPMLSATEEEIERLKPSLSQLDLLTYPLK